MLIELTDLESATPLFVDRGQIVLVEPFRELVDDDELRTDEDSKELWNIIGSRVSLKSGQRFSVLEKPEDVIEILRLWSTVSAANAIELRNLVEELFEITEGPRVVGSDILEQVTSRIKFLLVQLKQRTV